MPLRPTSLVLMMCSACAGVLAAEPSTYTLKPVPFRIEAKLEGTFEPPAIAEVRPDIRRWSQLVVEEAVPHGARVGKGDVLVRLDTEKLDETIRDLEIAGRLTDAGVKLLEREAAVLAKATPIQLEMAARSRRMVREDLERYEAREADLATALNDKQLESAEFSLANAEEELEQLEKMYEQDDLTEETEEIVLKRSRFEAEMARFNAALARDRHERVAGFDLPRRIEYLKSLDRLATLDFELSEHKLPLSLEKQRLELEKARSDQRKAAETLAELKAERARLPIRSPTDGIVYYGKWRQGKWTESETAAGKLRPGGQLDGRDTIMTVVRVGKPTVRVSVPEKELSRIAAGQPARVVPKAFTDVRLAGRVRAVTSVPVAVGRFEALIDIAEENPRLVAGMEADVRVVSESKPDALAVPKRAVFSDPLDDEKRFVYVYQGDGKEPQMRTVAVGRSNDELVVITAGLGVGERIMLEKPAGADGVKPKAEDGEKAAAKPKPDGGAAKPAKAPDEKPTKTQDEKPAAGATPPAKSGDASQSTAAQK